MKWFRNLFPKKVDHQKQLVVTFAFTENESHKPLKVVLLRSYPDWKYGKLDGIKGRIQKGESPEQAARREVEEQVGVQTILVNFHKIGEMEGDGWKMHVFCCMNDRFRFAKHSIEDHFIKYLPSDLDIEEAGVDNLQALVNLSYIYLKLPQQDGERFKQFKIYY